MDKGRINISDLIADRANLLIDNELIFVRPNRNATKRRNQTGSKKKNSTLNADANVMSIVIKAFADAPSLQRVQSCNICGCEDAKLRAERNFPLDAEKVSISGFRYLQDYVNEELKVELDCRMCLKQKKELIPKVLCRFIFFDHIILDTSDLSFMKNGRADWPLSDIPISVTLQDRVYRIGGISAYKPGHFIAYCFIKGDWFEYDDMATRAVKLVEIEEIKVTPHFLLYIFEELFD